MKPLLVGEQNPYSIHEEDALLPWPQQAAGNRLRRILGMTQDEYLAAFVRRNLVRGRAWKLADARERAAQLWILHVGPVVALGARVAKCFGAPFEPFSRHRGGRVLVLPHPSGLSRAWNAPGARERAESAVRELLAECAGTE